MKPSGPDGHRPKLLLLMAIFLLPPVAAWVAFHFFAGEMASSTVNSGQLVSPARPLQGFHAQAPDGSLYDASLFRGRWSYLIQARKCGDECLQQLYLTRQVRTSVNKDMPRVQRILLLETLPAQMLMQRLQSEHPDLIILRLEAGQRAALEALLSVDERPLDGHSLYLFDPLANYMMRYDMDMPPGGMLKDLRKLLKLSRIG